MLVVVCFKLWRERQKRHRPRHTKKEAAGTVLRRVTTSQAGVNQAILYSQIQCFAEEMADHFISRDIPGYGGAGREVVGMGNPGISRV